MKILVTGAKGQLGVDVVGEAESRGLEVIGVDVDELDITDATAVETVLTSHNPDAVIHCAAWTAVDAAEDAENADKVRAVNVRGTENIAKVCDKIGSKLLYVSTDYVFNGLGDVPWKTGDSCEPLNFYGQTKYEGEIAAAELSDKLFIVRISWVFGGDGNSNNFVKTMLKLGKSRDTLSVVNDQIGTPTYTPDLARLLVDMVLSEKYGVYHATNSEGEDGFISWFDFAEEVFKQAGMGITLNAVPGSEFPTKAKRPANSRLDKSGLAANGFVPLPDWRDAVKRYLRKL
ncbi:MAG: dTDP-4-dehydrorhamnose reductase [Oscillospiraceae bacterium]|nr:dTDP-4-dehydrorhamnose reductase [Oscillospiraceae bacterium]